LYIHPRIGAPTSVEKSNQVALVGGTAPRPDFFNAVKYVVGFINPSTDEGIEIGLSLFLRTMGVFFGCFCF